MQEIGPTVLDMRIIACGGFLGSGYDLILASITHYLLPGHYVMFHWMGEA